MRPPHTDYTVVVVDGERFESPFADDPWCARLTLGMPKTSRSAYIWKVPGTLVLYGFPWDVLARLVNTEQARSLISSDAAHTVGFGNDHGDIIFPRFQVEGIDLGYTNDPPTLEVAVIRSDDCPDCALAYAFARQPISA